MNRSNLALTIILSLTMQPLEAAYQSVPVETRSRIIEDGLTRYEVSRPYSSFLVQVLGDEDGIKGETYRLGHPWVAAKRGERFAVRLYNPLPVRVAVNLTVDSLNSITGKPSGIKDGDKWMIDPFSFITIRGWQVNGQEDRRFFFTDKHESYAKWREKTLGRHLSANCGVIGAAYFWSQKELDAYYEAHPEYRYPSYPLPYLKSLPDNCPYCEGASAAVPSTRLQNKKIPEDLAAKQRAGTGMGERESNPTIQVQFDFDRGMFELSQAVVIYYDFADEPTPNPFPGLSYAPEMP